MKEEHAEYVEIDKAYREQVGKFNLRQSKLKENMKSVDTEI